MGNSPSNSPSQSRRTKPERPVRRTMASTHTSDKEHPLESNSKVDGVNRLLRSSPTTLAEHIDRCLLIKKMLKDTNLSDRQVSPRTLSELFQAALQKFAPRPHNANEFEIFLIKVSSGLWCQLNFDPKRRYMYCHMCNFNTSNPSVWNAHLSSVTHKSIDLSVWDCEQCGLLLLGPAMIVENSKTSSHHSFFHDLFVAHKNRNNDASTAMTWIDRGPKSTTENDRGSKGTPEIPSESKGVAIFFVHPHDPSKMQRAPISKCPTGDISKWLQKFNDGKFGAFCEHCVIGLTVDSVPAHLRLKTHTSNQNALLVCYGCHSIFINNENKIGDHMLKHGKQNSSDATHTQRSSDQQMGFKVHVLTSNAEFSLRAHPDEVLRACDTYTKYWSGDGTEEEVLSLFRLANCESNRRTVYSCLSCGERMKKPSLLITHLNSNSHALKQGKELSILICPPCNMLCSIGSANDIKVHAISGSHKESLSKAKNLDANSPLGDIDLTELYRTQWRNLLVYHVREPKDRQLNEPSATKGPTQFDDMSIGLFLNRQASNEKYNLKCASCHVDFETAIIELIDHLSSKDHLTKPSMAVVFCHLCQTITFTSTRGTHSCKGAGVIPGAPRKEEYPTKNEPDNDSKKPVKASDTENSKSKNKLKPSRIKDKTSPEIPEWKPKPSRQRDLKGQKQGTSTNHQLHVISTDNNLASPKPIPTSHCSDDHDEHIALIHEYITNTLKENIRKIYCALCRRASPNLKVFQSQHLESSLHRTKLNDSWGKGVMLCQPCREIGLFMKDSDISFHHRSKEHKRRLSRSTGDVTTETQASDDESVCSGSSLNSGTASVVSIAPTNQRFPTHIRDAYKTFKTLKKVFNTEIHNTLMSRLPLSQVYFFGSRELGISGASTPIDIYIDPGGFYSGDIKEWRGFEEVVAALRTSGSFSIVNLPVIGRDLKFEAKHVASNSICHVFFGDGSFVERTKLVKTLMMLDERVGFALVAARQWALKSELAKFVPNVYVDWLMIYFLMQPVCQLLPPVKLLMDIYSGPRTLLNGTDVSFETNLERIKRFFNPAKCTRSCSEILGLFFEFYSIMYFRNIVLSPFTGTVYDRSAFQSPQSIPQEYGQIKMSQLINFDDSLILIDPLSRQINLLKDITTEGLDYFKTLCSNLVPDSD